MRAVKEITEFEGVCEMNVCGLAFGVILVLALMMMSAAEASAVQSNIPRPEHPRPDFQRDDWQNLNGTWLFQFDPDDVGEKERWSEKDNSQFTRTIVVPYPWESKLSGINDKKYSGAAWYRREFTVPNEWTGKKVFLKFGAVDWEAKVWVNGQHVGSHEGGYSPFEFQITKLVQFGASNRVTVRAFDVTHPEFPSGKQTGWYTKTSGIWQTVYVEARRDPYVELAHISPDIDAKQARFDVLVQSDDRQKSCGIVIEVSEPQQLRAARTVELKPGENRVSIVLDVPEPRLWEPDSPTLYTTNMTVRADGQVTDKVNTYFGMRKISTGTCGSNQFKCVYLNNHPVYLLGALHQSFNPDGIYTYPSDDYIRHDMEQTRRFGLNFLRIHIKVDEPRVLYWADRCGVMLMCDMPNFANHTPRARTAWEQTLRDAVARDFNHPAIIAWCDFNETWGLGGPKHYTKENQEWVRRMYLLTKQLDPTRLVEDNSPCHYDHVATDINSWHFYIDDYEAARRHIETVVSKTYPGSPFNFVPGKKQDDQAFMNSEYGGVGAGGGDRDISWCFKYLTTLLRRHAKIGGYIYTELTDIEWEHNGFMNYDRSAKEYGYDELFPGFDLKYLNNPDFLVIDAPPYSEAKPRETWRTKLFLSHFSNLNPQKLTLQWEFAGVDRFGTQHDYAKGEREVNWKQYEVVQLPEFEFQVPAEPALGTLRFRLVDESGTMIAANYVNISIASDVPPTELLDDKTCAIRLEPNELAGARWETMDVSSPHAAEKVFGTGAGYFEYKVRLPKGIDVAAITEIAFLAELGAKATTEKHHWPAVVTPIDYPQTDGKKCPSDVTVQFQGVKVAEITLPDDPADARGVLSHAAAYHHGSYGYLQKISLTGEQLETIKKAVAADRTLTIRLSVEPTAVHKGGLSIYGDGMGRYPLDPTLLIRTSTGTQPAVG